MGDMWILNDYLNVMLLKYDGGSNTYLLKLDVYNKMLNNENIIIINCYNTIIINSAYYIEGS